MNDAYSVGFKDGASAGYKLAIEDMKLDKKPQIMKKYEGDYSSLRARVARLEEALRRGIELHENCDADTCMCGEPMHHPLSDHKPVAMLQYYGDQWVEEAKSALEEK